MMRNQLRHVWILLLLLLGWISGQAQAPQGGQPFITRWTCAQNETIRVPLQGSYDYEWVRVDGVGNVVKNHADVQANQVLQLQAEGAGEYLLKAGPAGVSRMAFEMPGASAAALLSVEQWGGVEWTTFASAFKGCERLQFAEGAGVPDLSAVRDMSRMLEGCMAFNASLNDWDVSGVQHMGSLFADCESFNQPLDAWDLASVKSISQMFMNCLSFDQSLNDWDVSRVTDMRSLFSGCQQFNQPLDRWDVSNVTAMREMFFGCTRFNQPLAMWDVSRVTDMAGMFNGCDTFDQPLAAWDVSHVERMSEMFCRCLHFDQPLDEWDVSRVVDMSGMFWGCSRFNQPLARWDVSKVEDMSRMFQESLIFNQPLGRWNVSNVTDMQYMFNHCVVFNQPLGAWDVAAVTTMKGMLTGCTAFNQSLADWTLSSANVLSLSVCGMSMANYSATLLGWAEKKGDVASGLRVEATGMFYNAKAKEARATLLGEKGWTFIQDFESAEAREVRPSGATEQEIVLYSPSVLLVELEPATAYMQALNWTSSRPDIVLVGNNGLIFGRDVGTSMVRATLPSDPEKFAEFKVTVKYDEVQSVAMVKPPTVLPLGGAYQFIAEVKPQEADPSVRWSVEGEGATFEGNVLRVTKFGSVRVTCTSVGDEQKSVSHDVRVEAVPLSRLWSEPQTLVLMKGASQTLSMRYKPANATSVAVSWGGSSEVAQVNQQGVVRALKAGDAVITLTSTDGKVSAAVPVKVIEEYAQPAGVEIVSAPAKVKVGEAYTLAARVLPAEASQEVEWTVEGGATVDGAVLRATQAGNLKLSVRSKQDPTKTQQADVRAYVPLMSMDFAAPKSFMVKGEKRPVAMALNPPHASENIKLLSRAGRIVAVEDGNTLHALSLGEADIQAVSENGLRAFAKVMVIAQYADPQRVEVMGAPTRVKVNEPHTFRARVLPEDAAQAVVWSVEEEGAAFAGDIFTATKAGKYTVVATTVAEPKTSSQKLIVESDVPLMGIALEKKNLQLTQGDAEKLTVTFAPTDATNQQVTWSANGSTKVSVSDEGEVKALEPGEAIITVTSREGGFTDECKVTVVAKQIPAMEVVIEGAPTVMRVGDSYTLAAKVLPDGVLQDVEWSVMGAGAQIVDQKTLTVNAVGSVELTATAKAAPSPSKTVTITVVTAGEAKPLKGISLDFMNATLKVNSTKQLTVTYTPEDATVKAVNWSSSNDAVATVSATGLVTAHKKGDAIIKAVSTEGGHEAKCAVTVVEEYAAPTGVELVDLPARMLLGTTHALEARVLPSEAEQLVEWSVEGEGAKLEGRMLTVSKVGTVRVTVKVVAKLELAQSAEIAVYEPLQGLTLSQSVLQLKVDAEEMLTVTFAPEAYADKRVKWTSSDSVVASVSAEGKVKAVKVGKATITAQSVAGGLTAECVVTVLPDGDTSAESLLLAGVVVAPNPFGSELILRSAMHARRYELVNAMGVVVLSGEHTGDSELRVSTAYLPAGLYLVRLLDGRGGVRVMRGVRR